MDIKSLRSSRLALQLVLLIVILSLIHPSIALVSKNYKKRQPPQSLTYYLHGFTNLTSDLTNVSSVAIIPPATSTSAQGWSYVSTEILTKKANISSKQVGVLSGLGVQTGVGTFYSAVLLLATIKYNDGVYKGTIVKQGEADFYDKSCELVVIGGTGDFLGVQGYAIRTLISNTVTGKLLYTVVRFDLHLFYKK